MISIQAVRANSSPRQLALAFSVLAGAAIASNTTVDTYVLYHRITAGGEKFTASCAYLIVGGGVGVILSLILAHFFGARLDPKYTGFHSESKGFFQIVFLAGVISAVGTLCHLWGYLYTDPSTATVFAALMIPFALPFDHNKGQGMRKKLLPFVLVVMVGCVLTAYEGKLDFSREAIGLLTIASLIFSYNGSLTQDASRDRGALTTALWRFMALSVSGTVMAVVLTLSRGKGGELAHAIGDAFTSPWTLCVVTTTMGFAFLGFTWEFEALGSHAIPVSYVFTIVLAVSMVVAIPLTLTLDGISSGVVGPVPTTASVWSIRFIGVALAIVGLIAIAREEPATRQ